MVFARNALAPGPGNAWHSIHLPPTWRKVKAASIFRKFFPLIMGHFFIGPEWFWEKAFH